MLIPLTPHLARYSWGHPRLVGEWLGVDTQGPVAEAWFGTHPAGPTTVGSSRQTLADLLADDPARYLGENAPTDGRLPWLVKLLAAAEPLSLQVHPDAERAARQFNAGHPSYTDPWAKPELLVALVDSWALLGFDHPHLAAQRALRLASPGLAVLAGDGPVTAAARLFEDPELSARLAAELWQGYVADPASAGPFTSVLERWGNHPSVALALLLRPTFLPSGSAVELGPGLLHAYLSGGGLEVMGASDNVLRGGLTHKAVDLVELGQTIDPKATPRLLDADDHGTLDTSLLPCRVHRHGALAPTDQRPLTTVAGPAVIWCGAQPPLVGSSEGRMLLEPGAGYFLAAAASPVHLSGGSAFVITSR
jgi:mannose-6-phosphate isomerase